jgi:hypothetical protein
MVTVELEGNPSWSRDRDIGHYGAALDKQNSKTEGRTPYAWVFYLEYRGARGSGYAGWDGTKTSLVHAENLALARSQAGRWRAADRLRFNALPLTSDEALDGWIERLAVERYEEDTRHDVRQRCGAKYAASAGNARATVDDALMRLLGKADETTLRGGKFVRCWRQQGSDLANPPTRTYWPVINPGPAINSLGGGTWFSDRARLTVEVTPDGMFTVLSDGSTTPNAKFLKIMNVHLFRLLDRMLPIWSEFDWCLTPSDGFLLDIDQMDYCGMDQP